MSTGYAKDILVEARRERGRGSLQSPEIVARAANVSCGDEIELDISHDGVRISAIAHRTRGCAFTRASASLLARFVPDMTFADAQQLAARLLHDIPGPTALPSVFGALENVRMYPARTRCALLPWEALAHALADV